MPSLKSTANVVALPREELDDVELVRRACDGDRWAHEAIYRRYVQRVARVAQQLLRDPSDVDDIVQETFLVAFETLRRLAEPAALRGWLTGIAVHRVHRRFRWRRFTRLWTSVGQDDHPALTVGPDVSAELVLIDRVVAHFPLGVRTAWVLKRVLGDSHDDVAKACGCSVATAKRRVAEVEAALAAHVEGT
jgi:RNA polymerase sigma-70 factor (ECF subfamily)